jgi:hypothetical protein
MLIVPRMSPPTRSERARPRRGYGLARPALLLGAALALWSAHCTFPNYDVSPGPLGGTSIGGSAGTGATAGLPSGASGTLGGTPQTGEGGAAGLGEAGAPECRGEQWPVDLCPEGCLKRYPDHCYDKDVSEGEGELDLDCGGPCQPCAIGVCARAQDCLSGVCGEVDAECATPLALNFTAHEMNSSVSSTAWSMVLRNDEAVGGETFSIKDLALRFYFDRNGVVEPIVVRATQSNLQLPNGESHELKATSWLVERFEDATDAAYNAYVSIKFGDSGQLFPGDKILTYQQMLTGDTATSMFDQRANYSYTSVQAGDWQGVNVFYQGKLIWGLEPRPANPRSCFARGVNLNGPPLASVDGHAWQGAAEAGVTTTGSGISQGSVLHPVASPGVTTALGTATRLLAGQTLGLPTENGEYLAYLYVVSATNDTQPNVLTVQGVDYTNSTRFRAQAVDSGYAWSRLGPYRVVVDSGSLSIAVTSGSIHFAGIELWYPE